jgi:two-component system NtrC family sensor kinase
VLLNLLTNALDASSPGAVVAVRARVMQEEVAIDVEDRGTGIAPSDRDHVFSPFFTTKPPGKGTGLGLAICSRIVKRMKGRLTFVTEEGVGTTFTVWLGVARLRARQREAA